MKIHSYIHEAKPCVVWGLHGRFNEKSIKSSSLLKKHKGFVLYSDMLSVTSILLLSCSQFEPLTSSLHTLAALRNATINSFAAPLVLATQTLLWLCRIWECFLTFQQMLVTISRDSMLLHNTQCMFFRLVSPKSEVFFFFFSHIFKGIAHPKIHSNLLSTHTDGRVGEVFLAYKTLLVFQRKKRFAVISQTIEAKGDQDLKINKMNNKTIKCLHAAHAK